MTAVSTAAAGVAPVGRFVVSHTVLNQGDASAAASRTRFYLSTDAVRGGADVLLVGTGSIATRLPGTSASASVTVAVPAATAAGAYRVIACADDLAAVGEGDETNNCRATATAVTVAR